MCKEFDYCEVIGNGFVLPKIKTADSAHTGILPSVTRPFSARGPGYEAMQSEASGTGRIAISHCVVPIADCVSDPELLH